jgi:Ca2+-binding RTX toxin-like protein
MVGDDILFGEGQDDDIIGGWGNDWISGGTGDDGILGDDGRIYTSRNSSAYGEPLYGIAGLPPRIPTPGSTTAMC